MRAPRMLIIAMTVAALSIGSLVTPVSAAAPRVAIVAGIPGATVDVCLGSNEIRSGLRYGHWFQRTVAAGSPVIRFRKAAPGECTGTVLAQRTLTLVANDDVTIVGTKRSPRVLAFDDQGLGQLSPSVVDGSFVALRHAADLGSATIKAGLLTPVTPSADPVWEKGDQYLTTVGGGLVSVTATRPDSNKPIATAPPVRTGGPDFFTRVEWILVGTNRKNARIVVLLRDVLDL